MRDRYIHLSHTDRRIHRNSFRCKLQGNAFSVALFTERIAMLVARGPRPLGKSGGVYKIMTASRIWLASVDFPEDDTKLPNMETTMRSCSIIGAPKCACQVKLGLVLPRLATRSIRGTPLGNISAAKQQSRRARINVSAAAAAPAIESPKEVNFGQSLLLLSLACMPLSRLDGRRY